MDDILNKLDFVINELEFRSFFNSPAEDAEIENLENAINVLLTNDLKRFYLSHNGGFFTDLSWNIDELNDKEKYDSIKWNSNHFLKLDEIRDHFEYVEILLEIEFGENRTVKYLPFFQTKSQELYLIRFSLDDTVNSIHELINQTPTDCWKLISNKFSDFLENYINKEGDILPY